MMYLVAWYDEKYTDHWHPVALCLHHDDAARIVKAWTGVACSIFTVVDWA